MNLSSIARTVWQAGTDSVQSDRLLKSCVSCTENILRIADSEIDLRSVGHIEIVGFGKAGRGMAVGLIQSLKNLPRHISVSGHINVPADCAEALSANFPITRSDSGRCSEIASNVNLFAARPAGVNEPTEAAIHGTCEILSRLKRLKSDHLAIVLISGGGSALLESPVDGISLNDLLCVTRTLAAAGATIQELNTVRTHLSQVKGGGLRNHVVQGKAVSLIVSDVIGDPLDLIASGPTTPSKTSGQDALNLLKQLSPVENGLPSDVWKVLSRSQPTAATSSVSWTNHLIGSNSIAIQAAAEKARRLGFQVISLGSENSGEAADFGFQLAQRLQTLKTSSLPDARCGYCVLAGGETTVSMDPHRPHGKGGRNQEVVLAAANALPHTESWQQMALLSGGTDGEDGPTDAAGAVIDEQIAEAARSLDLSTSEFLRNHDSYEFFEAAGGLLKTGPTHTNVMDLAVGLAACPDSLKT